MARRVVVAGTLTAGEGNQEQLWSWTEAEPYWRARVCPPPGWVIWPAAGGKTRRGRGTLGPDLVNATEHARRVVVCGYAASMPTAGTEKLWSWSHAERCYWQPRQPGR